MPRMILEFSEDFLYVLNFDEVEPSHEEEEKFPTKMVEIFGHRLSLEQATQ